jgi:hypothetical protein
MKFANWDEMYEEAQAVVNELDPIIAKYPPHLGMLALAIEFASFEIGEQRIDADIICEMIRDVCRIRDTGDRARNPS